MNKNLVIQGRSGFTLAEVIVAVAILSFAIFSTWRVITSSVNSVTLQDKQIKALHIGQACLGRLEGNPFHSVVPENWTIDSGLTYTLSIYDSSISSDKIFITPDDPNWPISDYDNSDGILVADKDGNPYRKVISSPPPNSGEYNWDPNTLTLTFNSDDQGKEVQIYYHYYHLVDEGGTIPSSDGEGRKERVIKIITKAGDANEDGEINSGDIIVFDFDVNNNLDYGFTFCGGNGGYRLIMIMILMLES